MSEVTGLVLPATAATGGSAGQPYLPTSHNNTLRMLRLATALPTFVAVLLGEGKASYFIFYMNLIGYLLAICI